LVISQFSPPPQPRHGGASEQVQGDHRGWCTGLRDDAHAQEAMSRRLKADLARFKNYVEQQVGPVYAI
jgi:hypothetical protein